MMALETKKTLQLQYNQMNKFLDSLISKTLVNWARK